MSKIVKQTYEADTIEALMDRLAVWQRASHMKKYKVKIRGSESSGYRAKVKYVVDEDADGLAPVRPGE